MNNVPIAAYHKAVMGVYFSFANAALEDTSNEAIYARLAEN